MVKEWLRKWKKQICCVGTGFALFGLAIYGEKYDSINQGIVEREGYGGDSRKYDLLIEGISDESFPCTIEIGPQKYRQEEAEKAFEELFDQLPSLILGQNESLDQVRTDLNLITLFDDTGIRAIWQSEKPKIMDSYGRIASEEIAPEGEPVVLEVILTDGIYRREKQIELMVFPVLQSPEERMAADFQEQIRQIDMGYPSERYLTLPKEYKGQTVHYRNRGNSEYWILPILGIMAAVLLRGQERAQEDRKRKKRNQLLLLDYADVVYQLMVYTGAGLTVGKSWEHMVENYEKEKTRGTKEPRPAYEEMALTWNQIRYGLPEGKAINEFGRRCQLQPYMKLSSLLEQNRKTGTKNLNQLLEQEMTSAWEEQKHAAKRMGEEASTKLLAPLFLMLVVVMVIVMVPALMIVQ